VWRLVVYKGASLNDGAARSLDSGAVQSEADPGVIVVRRTLLVGMDGGPVRTDALQAPFDN
jgi:hypothetical protein